MGPWPHLLPVFYLRLASASMVSMTIRIVVRVQLIDIDIGPNGGLKSRSELTVSFAMTISVSTWLALKHSHMDDSPSSTPYSSDTSLSAPQCCCSTGVPPYGRRHLASHPIFIGTRTIPPHVQLASIPYQNQLL